MAKNYDAPFSVLFINSSKDFTSTEISLCKMKHYERVTYISCPICSYKGYNS